MAKQTKITALDNGPYLVKDPVVVVDAECNEFPSKRETAALCRCGDQRRSRSTMVRWYRLEDRFAGGGEDCPRGGRAELRTKAYQQ
jgi:hypothetical protein